MALIKCPECGKEVSDAAQQCPNCAFPLSTLKTDGVVRIKMGSLGKAGVFSGRQQASITAEGKLLWEGQVGDIAEIHFDNHTPIEVKYHLSAMHYGGTCSGVVDPSAGNKYNVQARQGIMKTILNLQRVDVIDSD